VIKTYAILALVAVAVLALLACVCVLGYCAAQAMDGMSAVHERWLARRARRDELRRIVRR
jgi:hypothetical protein